MEYWILLATSSFSVSYTCGVLFIARLRERNTESTSAPWVARCPVLNHTVQYLVGGRYRDYTYIHVSGIDLDQHYYKRAFVHTISPQSNIENT